ncbi:MAG: AAA family ATPase [Parachlamydiales bacterium]|nr:AAA family ATPase [Parachlamydiales bacterium]
MSENIVLIGFKASGKTTIGKKLAEKLERNFFDIDELILERYEKGNFSNFNIFEVYTLIKEKKFRLLENEIIKSFKYKNNLVIASSGGSLISTENQNVLIPNSIFVYLKASEKTLTSRLTKSIYQDKDLFDKTYVDRLPIYQNLADFTIDVDEKSVEDILNEIEESIYVE